MKRLSLLIDFIYTIKPPANTGLPWLNIRVQLEKKVERVDVGVFPGGIKDRGDGSLLPSVHKPVEIIKHLQGEITITGVEVPQGQIITSVFSSKSAETLAREIFRPGDRINIKTLPFTGTLQIVAVISGRIHVESFGNFFTDVSLEYKGKK